RKEWRCPIAEWAKWIAPSNSIRTMLPSGFPVARLFLRQLHIFRSQIERFFYEKALPTTSGRTRSKLVTFPSFPFIRAVNCSAEWRTPAGGSVKPKGLKCILVSSLRNYKVPNTRLEPIIGWKQKSSANQIPIYRRQPASDATRRINFLKAPWKTQIFQKLLSDRKRSFYSFAKLSMKAVSPSSKTANPTSSGA